MRWKSGSPGYKLANLSKWVRVRGKQSMAAMRKTDEKIHCHFWDKINIYKWHRRNSFSREYRYLVEQQIRVRSSLWFCATVRLLTIFLLCRLVIIYKNHRTSWYIHKLIIEAAGYTWCNMSKAVKYHRFLGACCGGGALLKAPSLNLISQANTLWGN